MQGNVDWYGLLIFAVHTVTYFLGLPAVFDLSNFLL
jgi:hypothetical protein